MNKRTINLTLTPEQQAQIEKATGQQVIAVTLQAETLEQRVAPGVRIPN